MTRGTTPVASESDDNGQPHEVYTSRLAHELRTPVTSIFGYLQLLSDDRLLDDSDMLRHHLAVVRGRAEVVAEAFDAMITDGPYRATLPVDVALQEIKRGRRSQFDTDIARTFLAASVEPLVTDGGPPIRNIES
jgi:signal transduction histidine kinase